MSAVRELVAALVAGGMDAVDAATMVARAGAEISMSQKSTGAERQKRYRERHKASQNVTLSRDGERNESVTNRNGDVTRVTRNESVTNRNEASQSVTNLETPLSLLLTSSESNQKKERKREGRASQLPDGWRPPDWQAAVDVLGSDQRVEQELTKFKNHALDKGRVSKRWGAAWANWLERALTYGGGKTNGPSKARPGNVVDAFREIREQLEAEAGGGSPTGTNPVLRLSRS